VKKQDGDSIIKVVNQSCCINCTISAIGPMHEEKILGNTQKTPLDSFPLSLPKVGIP